VKKHYIVYDRSEKKPVLKGTNRFGSQDIPVKTDRFDKRQAAKVVRDQLNHALYAVDKLKAGGYPAPKDRDGFQARFTIREAPAQA
jgi:hypothetical protein